MVGHALQQVIPDATFISSAHYDLRDRRHAEEMFKTYAPEQVIHLAARVGGIKANMENLGDFYSDNIRINTNVLDSARKFKTKKVLSMLSTCIYPDNVNYPLTEEQIHNGEPHKSNYAYAYAKRMLDVQSRAYRDQFGCNFITAVPNNLFGENDNYDLNDSHVIPAMMHKMHLAEQNNENVVLWGDGTPLREFTFAEDLARILLLLLENYNGPAPINIGNTQEYSINSIAAYVARGMKFNQSIVWDTAAPAGQFRKPSDNSRLLELGWDTSNYTSIEAAIERSCEWFIKNYDNARGTK